MNFNRVTKQIVVFVAGLIILIILHCIEGTNVSKEQIVYAMPQEAYEAIYLKLGNGCTDRQIADEYMANKQYYDALSQ